MQHGSSGASGTVTGTSATITPDVAVSEPGTNDAATDTEEPRATPSKRPKTIMAFEIFVLDANTNDHVDDDDDVPSEVAHELLSKPRA